MQDSSLEIRSGRDINLVSDDTRLHLGPDDIQVIADSLQVQSNSGDTSGTILSVSEGQLSISASQAVLAQGSMGLTAEQVQGTSKIDSGTHDQLQITAPAGYLSLTALSSLLLEAQDGPIDIVTDASLTLESTQGSVSIIELFDFNTECNTLALTTNQHLALKTLHTYKLTCMFVLNSCVMQRKSLRVLKLIVCTWHV